MKRIFPNLLVALAAGACLRLLFVLKFPTTAGDTGIYELLATNWVQHHMLAMDINGVTTPVDLRMPGYPAFLAVLYGAARKVGEDARGWVMFAQVGIDLATCVLAGFLAGLLAVLCGGVNGASETTRRRAFVAGVWLAALCPFTANYVAVPLTEVWATFWNAGAMCLLVLLVVMVRGGAGSEALSRLPMQGWTRNLWWVTVAAGFVVGMGTLFRPETPLLLVTTCVLLAVWLVTRGEWRRLVLVVILLGVGCAVPLVPWAIRNFVTLHEFQPLAPKDATVPGEVDPKGFMAWERTWLYRLRDCYLVPWKLNDEAIRFEDIPVGAFDSEEQRARGAAAIAQYNQDLNWTADEDAVFAEIAKERNAAHPLRTYVWIPLRRTITIWFTPRIELIPVSGHVFPMRKMWDVDRVDQVTTIAYFFLGIAYIAAALWGLLVVWRRCSEARAAIVILAFYAVVRTGFLTTLETPEPRYVLVCFPILFALIAQGIALRGRFSTSKTI